MDNKQVRFTFACNLVDDADLLEVIQSVPNNRRSKLIRRLIRAGISAEAFLKTQGKVAEDLRGVEPEWKPSILFPPAASISQRLINEAMEETDDVSYEDDPDVTQARPARTSTHFHPVPKPGAKR